MVKNLPQHPTHITNMLMEMHANRRVPVDPVIDHLVQLIVTHVLVLVLLDRVLVLFHPVCINRSLIAYLVSKAMQAISRLQQFGRTWE